ncbi:MAG: FtsX-like permease family protein [Candidatus Bathyarchaeia archaeon]|jgi:putative ABC transport system permease protein
MGIIGRAVRNISRRKMRALLVIVALGFSLSIMISIPAGVLANEKTANTVASNLSNIISQTGATINQTLTQIDCSLAPSFSGFGFTRPSLGTSSGGGFGGGTSGGSGFTPGQFGGGTSGGSGFTPGQFGGGTSGGSGFTPGQFGGGTVGGYFGGGAFNGGQANPMNESLYSDINSSISGIGAVEPILQASEGNNVTRNLDFNGYTRTITILDVEYTIEGVPLTSSFVGNYPILPTNITAGSNLQAGDSGAVLLSENNSAYFGAGVGDAVTILGQSFTVAGIYSPSSVSDTQTLYMNLSDAQALTNNTGYITSLTVFAQNSDVVSQVASSISSLHPELTVTTGQDRESALQTEESTYNAELTSAQASDSQTNSTAIEEIVVVVLATSLIVLFVMLYTVKERTKEIGTLKAIGFSNSAVMGQFMLEGVLLSMLAGVVGIAIGSIAAPTISSLLLPSVGGGSRVAGAVIVSGTTRFGGLAVATLTPELVLLGFGVAILLGTLGSLYPAWRAAKIRPAEAMRYE